MRGRALAPPEQRQYQPPERKHGRKAALSATVRAGEGGGAGGLVVDVRVVLFFRARAGVRVD